MVEQSEKNVRRTAARRADYAPLGEDKFAAIKRDYAQTGELRDNAAYGFVKV